MIGLPPGLTVSTVNRGFRYSSTNAFATKSLAKLLVFPLTNDKSFLYFKYNQEQLLNNNSLLVKYENKAVALATKAWNSLRSSDKSYNKKIVYYANKFLEQTPWTEDSLRSIPSKASLLRQVRRTTESKDPSSESHISIKSTEDIEHELETIINIPVYYPSTVVSPDQLSNEITTLATQGEAYHRRYMIFTGIGVPISLPFALVPILPNIPGFYLAYRFYCNFKAMLGSRHLNEMQQGQELIMKKDAQLEEIYEDVVNALGSKQGLLINEGIIDKVVDTYDIPEARAMLLKALKQERKKLTDGEKKEE